MKKRKQAIEESPSLLKTRYVVHAVGRKFEIRNERKGEKFGPYSTRTAAETAAKILNTRKVGSKGVLE
jgi:hypothetical protein